MTDDYGDPWLVYEMDCRGAPDARGDRCLVCANAAIIRRIWDYPANWPQLSDHALTVVCGI